MSLQHNNLSKNFRDKKKCFIVLGHEINHKTFDLSNSSKARCEKLAQLIIKDKHFNENNFIIFMGLGRKQGNCRLSISECMHKYFEKNFFKIKNCFLDKKSLDSVGDAIFSFQYLKTINFEKKIIIITSDWHMNRAKNIFKKVYGNNKNLIFFETNELDELNMEQRNLIKSAELRSLELFDKNFKNYNQYKNDPIDFLIKNHQLY